MKNEDTEKNSQCQQCSRRVGAAYQVARIQDAAPFACSPIVGASLGSSMTSDGFGLGDSQCRLYVSTPAAFT